MQILIHKVGYNRLPLPAERQHVLFLDGHWRRSLATTVILIVIHLATAQSPTPSPSTKTPTATPSQTSESEKIIEIPVNRPSILPRPARKLDQAGSVQTRGNMEILSDTRGVDFAPYMRCLHVVVEDHWYPLIPEVALPPVMKSGRVAIQLAIMKDGAVQQLKIVQSAGDASLDRAAYGALINSVPLPHLPPEFTGNYLLIRCTFFYNPGKAMPSPSPSPDKQPAPDK